MNLAILTCNPCSLNMKVTSTFLTLALAIVSYAAPAVPDDAKATSTMTSAMIELRQLKEKSWARQKEQGVIAAEYASVAAVSTCTNGYVNNTYRCSNVDLYGFLSHQALGSSTRVGNDVWGWAKNGREFGLVGQTDGTAFVEVLSDGSLKYIGRLPTQTRNSSWRDIKVIGDYAYIGSEAASHGLQVFNLNLLLTTTTPRTFALSELTAAFTGFGNSHNIVANADTNHIYAVGSGYCSGGLYQVNVANPAAPTNAGCVSGDGYVHDAQCVIYNGPTTAYQGKEICFGYNENTLTIYDVTVKSSPTIISRTAYTGTRYTHQGWLVSDKMEYLLLDDELDEYYNTAPGGNAKTTTYIWDIRNLVAPVNTGYFKSSDKSIDHNQYTLNGLTYQSNYASGLHIVDISSIPSYPNGSRVKEVGYFDVYPEDDSSPINDFYGTWSNYPYLSSGYVLVNSIERGVFSVKYTGPTAAYTNY